MPTSIRRTSNRESRSRCRQRRHRARRAHATSDEIQSFVKNLPEELEPYKDTPSYEQDNMQEIEFHGNVVKPEKYHNWNTEGKKRHNDVVKYFTNYTRSPCTFSSNIEHGQASRNSRLAKPLLVFYNLEGHRAYTSDILSALHIKSISVTSRTAWKNGSVHRGTWPSPTMWRRTFVERC